MKRSFPQDGLMTQFALGTGTLPITTPLPFEIDFKIRKLAGIDALAIYYKGVVDPTLDLGVEDSCVFELRLSKKQWRWSTNYQALTTKEKYEENNVPLYTALRYVDSSNKEICWSLGMTGSYSTIRFSATLKSGVPELHGFCLNVEYLISADKGIWLPVSIDPDIINPKPGSLIELFLAPDALEEIDGVPLFAVNEWPIESE